MKKASWVEKYPQVKALLQHPEDVLASPTTEDTPEGWQPYVGPSVVFSNWTPDASEDEPVALTGASREALGRVFQGMKG